MRLIKKYLASWAKRWAEMELAMLVTRALVILIVPGALWIWLAWWLLHARNTAQTRQGG